MVNRYYVGSKITMKVKFSDQVGAAWDPDTVTFKLRKPDGTVVSYTYLTNAEVVRTDVGMFQVTMIADLPGSWVYRYEGTGIYQVAKEDELIVVQTAF